MNCPACNADIPETSRFCPSCGTALGADELANAVTFMPTRAPSHPHTPTPSQVTTPSSSTGALGFQPGEILDGRYRIIGLLGQGGMGEVYRADDLKLGQPVALKFLPEELAADELKRAAFYHEVRIARGISHANVCRVYDVAEWGGHPYLSMELIDGEDLATLLRRVGRLPVERGVQIARQICLGVAAAHEKKILHRDLKPSNIMIDGNGNACVTDFGLAGLAEALGDVDFRSGTPAYMAPEQMDGAPATVRSDIYGLGLVLYEIFTGRRAFVGATMAEIRRQHTETTPASPSTLIRDLDPTVERVILRCLERDPRDRPASVLAVSAALPGGDPLAAALAAGELPSPEVVAAAGVEGSLRPLAATSLLLVFLAGVVAVGTLGDRVKLHRMMPLEKPPAVLVDRAREVIRDAGYRERPVDDATGWTRHGDALQYVSRTNDSPDRWSTLASCQPPALTFWYREALQALNPLRVEEIVTPSDPPPDEPAMKTVVLDPRGNLVEFLAVPPQRVEPEGDGGGEVAAPDPVDWSGMFAAAGLDLGRFQPVDPIWTPPVFADSRQAWEGTSPEPARFKLRVEAAAYGGRPVSFRVIGPWVQPEEEAASAGRGTLAGQLVNATLVLGIILGGVLWARHNLRSGRGDRRGAFRLALFVLLAAALHGLMRAHHTGLPQEELDGFVSFVGYGLFFAGFVWVAYLSLEPYVRHRWPRCIISWTRLLAGRPRDPMVGRDLLIGSAFSAGLAVLPLVAALAPAWLGHPPPVPEGVFLAALSGPLQAGAQFLDVAVQAVFNAVAILFIPLLLMFLVRKSAIAFGLSYALIVLASWLLGGGDPVTLVLSASIMGIYYFLLLRFGVLAMAAGLVCQFLLRGMPVTMDFSTWYAGSTILTLAGLLVLAGYGFWTALAGQSLIRGSLMEE